MHSSLKFIVIFLIAFFCAVIPNVHAQSSQSNNIKIEAVKLSKPKAWTSFSRSPLKQKIQLVEGLQGKHNYIVQLKDKAVASYRGGVPGYKATAAGYAQDYNSRLKSLLGNKARQQRASLKLDLESNEVKQYQEYLKVQQNDFLQRSSALLGYKPSTSYKLQLAFNGVVMKLSQEEAKQIAVEPETEVEEFPNINETQAS